MVVDIELDDSAVFDLAKIRGITELINEGGSGVWGTEVVMKVPQKRKRRKKKGEEEGEGEGVEEKVEGKRRKRGEVVAFPGGRRQRVGQVRDVIRERVCEDLLEDIEVLRGIVKADGSTAKMKMDAIKLMWDVAGVTKVREVGEGESGFLSEVEFEEMKRKAGLV